MNETLGRTFEATEGLLKNVIRTLNLSATTRFAEMSWSVTHIFS